MSDKSVEQVLKIIDQLQSGLVDLFDQLRELRRLLNIQPELVSIMSSSIPSTAVSTDAEKSSSVSSAITASPKTHSVDASVFAASSSSITTTPTAESMRDTGESSGLPKSRVDASTSRTSSFDVTVGRLLDPLAHELKTGDSPANVIAELLEHVKIRLSKLKNFEIISKDVESVLKFLKNRGNRTIRPEERNNILRRIARWKVELSSSRT